MSYADRWSWSSATISPLLAGLALRHTNTCQVATSWAPPCLLKNRIIFITNQPHSLRVCSQLPGTLRRLSSIKFGAAFFGGPLFAYFLRCFALFNINTFAACCCTVQVCVCGFLFFWLLICTWASVRVCWCCESSKLLGTCLCKIFLNEQHTDAWRVRKWDCV